MLHLTRSTQAALGEREDSVEKDRQLLGGTRITMENSEFTVHQITTGGTILKEYVSPQGIIFGVSWRGRVHPDLSILLGSYYLEYQNALEINPKKKGRGSSVLKSSNFHIEKSGHMRDLTGRAFVSNLIPKGLTDEVVQ